MAIVGKSDAKTGFWVAIGVLSALAVWQFLSSRLPSIQGGI